MTKIITRYFDTAENAKRAKDDLMRAHRVSPRIMHIYDDAAGLDAGPMGRDVAPATRAAYQQRLANGGAVLCVEADYTPLGVARLTREVAARRGGAAIDGLSEEVVVKRLQPLGLSILPGHPHMMTARREPGSTNYHMANWPIPLINRRPPGMNSLTSRDFQLTAFAYPLTDRRIPFSGSIFPRHARMANFPIPLISRRTPFTGSIFSRHARMANFPIRLISRRKPFTGSIIPRHGRMATVPFPLLINGKTGQNALMPGGPRMANFPIRLISQRKPFTGSIFPRHARMAKFPIGLISRRKPFTGSLIPRHGRMANMFLPLVIRRSDESTNGGGRGFSFSKMIGFKTLSSR